MQLISADAFRTAMPTTTAPKVLLFKRFKEKWDVIDQDSYEDSFTDKEAAKGVEDI